MNINDQNLEHPKNTITGGCSAEKLFESPPSNFSLLPVELQIRIFRLVIGTKESKLLCLTSICRLWRTIIIDSRALWRSLIISQKTTREKAETWLCRAGGAVSSLSIRKGFDFDTLPDMFGGASAAVWLSLTHLEISFEGHPSKLLSATAYEELRLRGLELFSDGRSPEFWDSLWTIDASHMSNFQVEYYSNRISISGSRFSGLVTLRIDSVEDSDVFSVLEQNPMLETLKLVSTVRLYTARVYARTCRIELGNLRHLELSMLSTIGQSVESYLQYLIYPNLKVLILSGCTLRRSEALLSNTLTHLEELSLYLVVVDVSALITLLRNSRALRKFKYVESGSNPGTNDAIEALVTPIPGEETLCCPRLQHVDLRNLRVLTTALAMQLVKARLPSSSIRSEGGFESVASGEPEVEPLPIVYLRLSWCPAIYRESWLWFEAKVPEFIHEP